MPPYVQANTLGRLHDAAQPSISPLDRGYLYGDAIYEVWRTYGGVVFAFAEHWERLQRSAAALQFPTGIDAPQLLSEMQRTAEAFRAHTGERGELYLRLQLARGAGPIGLDVRLADAPRWVLLVQSLRSATPAAGRSGLRLHVATRLRRNSPAALDPAWKTGNYLNNVLCLREALSAGADDVLILNQQGNVTEAAAANVFFVQQGTLVTPPLSAGILAGVTRDLILRQVAARAGLGAREEDLGTGDLDRFDECFLSSTTRGVAAVESIDSRCYATGEGGPTAHLKAAFEAYALEHSARHPELTL